jgi:hypothetical protein
MYKPRGDLSTLVLAIDEPQGKLTNRCETDCRTALTRGLAEYLKQLELTAGPQGRGPIRFESVVYNWEELREPPKYPGVVVQAPEDGDHSHQNSGQTFISSDDEVEITVPPAGEAPARRMEKLYAGRPSSYDTSITVTAWATDREERMWLCKLLEDWMVSPVMWMNGFRLNLPHYHGERATYLFEKSAYQEQSSDAQRGIWKVVYRGTASVNQIRLYTALPLIPRILDTQVAVNAELPEWVKKDRVLPEWPAPPPLKSPR